MQLDPMGHVDGYNGKGFFQVRDNWQGKGFRLYFGDDSTCCQVDGEINGRVFRTISAARAYCAGRFGVVAKRSYT